MRLPELYIMTGDGVRPKRRWLLRRGADDLSHWANADHPDSGNALPLCHEYSGARLVIFFRRAERFKFPTCLWCIRYPVRRGKLRFVDQRRAGRR